MSLKTPHATPKKDDWGAIQTAVGPKFYPPYPRDREGFRMPCAFCGGCPPPCPLQGSCAFIKEGQC
jgi:hypothetical protein